MNDDEIIKLSDKVLRIIDVSKDTKLGKDIIRFYRMAEKKGKWSCEKCDSTATHCRCDYHHNQTLLEAYANGKAAKLAKVKR